MTDRHGTKLMPASRDAFDLDDTPGGVVVTMTTAPRHVFRPDGFLKTAAVTRWTRGPMHRDDAAVLVRIAAAHGTDPAKWTPVIPRDEDAREERHDPTGGFGPYDGQGDFGDLFRS